MEEIDLKYRPKKFSEVVGNAAVVKLLLTRSKQRSLVGRSMMFGGPKGCGKTTLARIVARAIVCDELSDGEPCGECMSCHAVSDESSTSFDEYDAATQGTVDRVRSLIEDLDYGSLDGKPRVVILDEAHRLSKPSQDALLKSMEDRRLVVILCTTEPRKIVDAIRSRVEEYPVTPPPDSVLIPFLDKICVAEDLPCETEALTIVAKALNNCPRECVCAISTLRDLGGVTQENAQQLFRYDRMKLVVDCLGTIDKSTKDAFSILDALAGEGATWIRDMMVSAISGAMRQAVGAKSNFPIQVSFFGIRGISWSKLAQVLGSLDKPTMADLEAALLSTMQNQTTILASPLLPEIPIVSSPQVHPTEAVQVPIPSQPKPSISAAPVVTKLPSQPIQVVKPVVPKSIEIDGVKFTHDESLTSLDSKMEKGLGVPTGPETVSAKIGHDSRHVPLPEKEFASGLVRKLKSI